MKARSLSVLVALAMLLQLFFFTPAGAVRAAPPLDMGINATLVVNSAQDNDNGACDATHCTLREAIHYAASGDTINFDSSLSGATIVLGSELSISKNLTIDASALAERVKVSGNHASRVFWIGSGFTVSMNYLEVIDGNGGTWGAIYNNGGTLTLTNMRLANNAGSAGAALTNQGTLTIVDCTFESNQSITGGGGVLSYGGSSVSITGSTFRDNSGANGAALDFQSGNTVAIQNSTISGNTGTETYSAAIINSGATTLLNVTVANNTGRGLRNTNLGTLHYTNTLIAGSSGDECVNEGTIGVNSHNLVEDGTCSAALSGNPLLEPLADNGGDTLTHALQLGSPAVDAGDPGNCPATDQRGVTRPKDGDDNGSAICDIGAFELSNELDYGDAPAPFPTLKADNGARHYWRPGYQLGLLLDIDANGFPSANADGDDLDNQDDEDGVTFTTPLRSGEYGSVDAVLTGGAGYLHAWIDFNQDGDWADVGEKTIPGVYKPAGTQTFTFLIPPDALLGNTAARFRFTSRPKLPANGVGIGVDGEVEDYIVTILRGKPVANPDEASLDENTSVLIDVLPNDYDPHGTVSLQSVGAPTRGTAVIEAGKVRYTPSTNYSGPDSFPYTIVSDIGLTQTARVTIFVRDVNSTPTDIQIMNQQPLVATCKRLLFSTICTLPANTLVGTLRGVDPDPGDSHTFNLVNSPFRLSGTALYTLIPITFTGATTIFPVGMTAKATDKGNLSYTKTFTLFILGDKVSGGPTQINLSNKRLMENLPAATLVGTLTTQDAGSYPPYTYSLVSGEGSGDNSKFQVAGDQLQTATPLDFEAKELYRVRIRTQNNIGQFTEQGFVIQLLDDTTEPPQPPPNCSGGSIELINSDIVQLNVLNVAYSNVTLQGCDIQGELSLTFPGWSGSGIDIEGSVNKRNQLIVEDIGEINMAVAGVPLKVKEPELEYYDGRVGLRLGKASFCLPSEWGGLCAPAVLTNGIPMLIDDNGLKAGAGLKIGFPEIKVGNYLSLSKLSGKLDPVPGGYEITLAGEFGLPKFKPGGANGCGISASVTIYAGAKGEIIMEIHARPPSVDAVSLREITVGISCDVGIPIDNTGLAVTGVEGTVSLRPDSQFVSLSLTVSTIKKIPVLNISPIKAVGTATLHWHPQWGLDLGAVVYMLDVFKTAQTQVSIRENRVSYTANFTSFLVNGQVSVNAWTDWSSFHFTGRGNVQVGFRQGQLLHKCACIPYPTAVCWKWFIPYPCGWKEKCVCLDIPPVDLFIAMGAEVGEFTNGKWGFKGYVSLPVVGNVGIYVDTKPSLKIGGVDQYRLLTPPTILAALSQWRNDRAMGVQTSGALGQVDDILVQNDSRVSLRVPVNVKSVENGIQDQQTEPVELPTQKNTLFAVSASELLLVTLQAPDGTVITPSNYNQPPVTPTYQVEYAEDFYYQPNTAGDQEIIDQPRLRFVLAATHASWQEVDVSLDGTLLWNDIRLDSATPANYIPIHPGEHTVSMAPSGGGTAVTLTFNVDFQQAYTLLAAGDGAAPSLTVFTDDNAAPSAQGKVRVRFVHSAPYANAVDVYLEGVQMMNDGAYLDESAYFEFDEGEALLEIKDAVSGDLIAPPQSLDLTAGGVYSLFDAVYPQGAYQLACSQYLDEGYVERYYMQYKVYHAPAGDWEVTLDGNLDTSLPMLAVLGFANPPQWERVEAQATDPFHPEITWEVKSDYLPTSVWIYANPDVYEDGGEPVYQGFKIAEVELDDAGEVIGDPFTTPVDLSTLESGTYTLWVRVEDGVNPPISAYALTPGGGAVAQFTIDQSTTFPTTWTPAINAVVSNTEASVFLEWPALLHPDVDSYNLYFNTVPLTPVLYTEGLSAFRAIDENGQPFGPVLVNTLVSALEAGMTYYYSVEAVDAETGKKVRSPEASFTVAGGDFALSTPILQYLMAPGGQVSFPLSLNVLQPLYYPNVGLSIDYAFTPPGMRVWFDAPFESDAYLTVTDDSVDVTIELTPSVASGIYPVTFVGRNGDLKRSLTIYILVNPDPTDLQISGTYLIGGDEEATFTFVVENLGAAPGDGAVVTIPLPASISNITWSCVGTGGAVCGSGTGNVVDTIGNLKPGNTATYTVTGNFLRFTPFQVTGVVSWLGVDTNLLNNAVTLVRMVVIFPTIYNNRVP